MVLNLSVSMHFRYMIFVCHLQMISTYYNKLKAVKRHDQKVEFKEDSIRLDIPFPSSTGRITDNGAWRIMALGPPLVSFKLP